MIVSSRQTIAVGMAAVDLGLSTRRSRAVSFYLTIITLAIFAFYAYRDIWPLMTFTLHPVDEQEGSLLWFKVALSTWAAILEPLLEPYPFIPVHPEVSTHIDHYMAFNQLYRQDPTAAANPEQTASILRWIFWSFLDPVIWRAYKLPHLPHDQLPPLADYDEAHYLTEKHYEVCPSVVRTHNSHLPFISKLLDPLKGAKSGSMVLALIKVVRVPLTIQGICVLLTVWIEYTFPYLVTRMLFPDDLRNDKSSRRE